jgi:hypothetical protein
MDKEKILDDINLSNISNHSIQDDEDLSKSKIIISQEFDITKNIKVISSDVCGLGKSFKIKNDKRRRKKILSFSIRRKIIILKFI